MRHDMEVEIKRLFPPAIFGEQALLNPSGNYWQALHKYWYSSVFNLDLFRIQVVH
jgi:hypothetical protein